MRRMTTVVGFMLAALLVLPGAARSVQAAPFTVQGTPGFTQGNAHPITCPTV